MTKSKKTAPAAKKDVLIEGAKPTRKRIDGKQVAFVSFKGDAPEDGANIRFTAINDVTYSGTVKSAIEVDGVVTCELSDGPHVVTK